MATNVFLRVPNSTVKITVEDGQMTLPWRRFFQDMTNNVNNSAPATFGPNPPVTAGTINGQVYYQTAPGPDFIQWVWYGAWKKVA